VCSVMRCPGGTRPASWHEERRAMAEQMPGNCCPEDRNAPLRGLQSCLAGGLEWRPCCTLSWRRLNPMRADIVAGAVFPDLTDHAGKRRTLSDLQGPAPHAIHVK
jgi:hypothetical protein